MFNLSRALITVSLSMFPVLKAHSAVLVVGENCVYYNEKNQIASFAFDSESRKLLVHTQNVSDDYDWSKFMSGPLTTPPKFGDRNNPLRIVNLKNETAGVVFGTKNTISISSNGVNRMYHCQAYYPSQLGMSY